MGVEILAVSRVFRTRECPLREPPLYCLTTPHELTNFHILEFNLKQFESFGNKHL